jgi:hypothetical protein
MALVGAIRREPKLTLDEWSKTIEESENLVSPPIRTVENIFTGNTETWLPPQGKVRVVVGGELLGAISPSDEFEQTGELDVWARDARHSAMRRFAEELAQRLGAQLEWDE